MNVLLRIDRIAAGMVVLLAATSSSLVDTDKEPAGSVYGLNKIEVTDLSSRVP
jgi:hypothetical protein